ncbi:MAG: Trp operon repressor [Flammeovirgaceae bacterium]|jgi:Trp operon repressor
MKTHPIYKVLKRLESEEEFLEFIDITFTEKEREMMLERWRIFSAIEKGLSQREVAKQVECSVATATRGAKAFRQNKDQIQKWLGIMQEKED